MTTTSPDFNPCDYFFLFFLLGFMKEQIYTTEIDNGEELLIRINNVANDIRQTSNL